MLKIVSKIVAFLFSTLFVVNSLPTTTTASHSEIINSVYSENVVSSEVVSNEDVVSEQKVEKDIVAEPSDEEDSPEKKVSVLGVYEVVETTEATKASSETENKTTTTKPAATTTKPATTTTKPATVATTKATEKTTTAAKTSFSTSKSNVYVNYSTNDEKWIAQNLINANSTFSVKEYPALQNYQYLLDVIDKVIYQNPYILGVCSRYYDSQAKTVTIHYAYDQSSVKSRQNAINSAANRIIGSIISGNMSDEQKRLAIYNYLQNNASYDDAAAAAAKASGYKKTSDHTYEDSFNPYGVLVKKKGVCMSYASAFKLLCDMAGVTCVYVTGTLNGTSHMWNLVKIDGAWYHTDPTNNKNVCGVPYKLYNAPQALASANGYSVDKDFVTDSEYSSYKIGTSYNYEYYTKNKLVANNFNEYQSILKNALNSGSHFICVRLTSGYNQSTFIDVVSKTFNSLGMGSSLSKASGSQNGQYVIVSF